ncbi:MAG: response regulator transcription factor [Marmoricola sp.]
MSLTTSIPTAVPRDGGLTRAVLVDDHRLLAQTLAMALGFEGIECTVADLGDREALVRQVVDGPPALVLLDLDLGGEIGDGADLVAPFVMAGCRVLVVSGSTDADQVCRALGAGAAGIIGKDAPFERLLGTALAVARGEQVLAFDERQAMLDGARRRRERRERELAPFTRLSDREGQVLRALSTGHSVGSIAEAWFVSEATVRSQVRAILTKLGVSSQLEAVAMAHRCHWL